MESPINIVFATDKSYAEHLAVSLCSLFENNKNLALDVYLLNADIDGTTWYRLQEIAQRYGQNLIDIKIADQELEDLVTTHHFTKANYYRLLIAEKLNASKALYLDADIVVAGSISDLYNTDLDGAYLAAVVNPGFDRHQDLEMSRESKYFNSGVMLLNLVAWRRDDIKSRVISLVRRKPWAIQFVDQCGLNSVIDGHWKELHVTFNVQGCLFENTLKTYAPLYPDGELADALKAPTIIHYSGSLKPWHLRYKHPWRRFYWKYLRMTPFNHRLSSDFKILDFIKSRVPKALKDAVRGRSQG